ncbi:MAG: hypothetical protein J0I34_26925 [Pseudonocardia sp.]|nr:hypothetical protein [Pseudonocardia sp.]
MSGLAGKTLYVAVGQHPDTETTEFGTAPRAFNGGGAPGVGRISGGGGGASDVRTVSSAAAASLASRLVVAGGGGGHSGTGSVAAADAGQNGLPAAAVGADGQGGFAGSQTAGGAGGAAAPPGPQGGGVAGKAGSAGQGGDGALGVGAGGGGGGGFYGGGGGGAAIDGADDKPGRAGGGGGGSSLVPAGGSQALTSDPASVTITFRTFAPPAPCGVTGQAISCTFGFTGAEQSFVVPVGVTSVEVAAIGAAGGGDGTNAGGRGARVTGTLTGLSGGQTLYVVVGEHPDTATTPSNELRDAFNGGGKSGRPGRAGGGGGATDVRTVSGTSDTSLMSRLIVAGGGGGRAEPIPPMSTRRPTRGRTGLRPNRTTIGDRAGSPVPRPQVEPGAPVTSSAPTRRGNLGSPEGLAKVVTERVEVPLAPGVAVAASTAVAVAVLALTWFSRLAVAVAVPLWCRPAAR